MLKSNGICIGIDRFRDRKKPSLYVMDTDDNVIQIVASFTSTEAAEEFQKVFVDRFMEGLIEKRWALKGERREEVYE